MKFPRVLSIIFLAFLLTSSIQYSVFSIGNTESSIQHLTYLFEHSKDITDHKDVVHSVVFSPNGRMIASGSADSNAKLWRADSGKQIRALMRHPSPVLCVAFSPDNNVLAVGAEDGTITLWDVNYKERIKTLRGHEGRVWSIRFSPDGSILASGSTDKTVRLWDMRSGKEIAKFSDYEGFVYSLAFSPDGKLLASGSMDIKIRVPDASSREPVITLREDARGVSSICFSPDGKTLASGARNGLIRLWSMDSGEELATFSGHNDSIGINDCLSFSPDGKILLSGSSDRTILVWDVSTGNVIEKLDQHKAAINSIALSPDGKSMASAGSDGVIKLWKIRIKESLKITLNAEYDGWQRGILALEADVLGVPDMVKFQYSIDGSSWLYVAENKEPPYSVNWDTRMSIPEPTSGIRLRVVAERITGITATDTMNGDFSMDNELPNTEDDYDGLWHTEDFQINLSADDGKGIGLADTRYRLNQGTERILRWNGQPKITDEGANTLEYWSVDKLGNEEQHKVLSNVNLDKTAPEFNVSRTKELEAVRSGLENPDYRLEGKKIRASVRLMDRGGSGLAEKTPQFDYHIGSDTAYRGYEDMSEEDSGAWYYDIPEPPEGWDHYSDKPLYYRVRCEDVAGNLGESAEQQELIGSEKSPPTVKIARPFEDWEGGKLAISAEASDKDGAIGDAKFEYSFDGVSWASIGSKTTSPYSVEWDTSEDVPEVERDVWVRITATDNDGLSAQYITSSFGVDNQPPTTSHDYDGLWHKNAFTISLTADDGEGGGVSSIKYKLNGGIERDVSTDGQPKISKQGKNTLEYWSVDASGNEEPHKILSDVNLDRMPPLIGNWRMEREGNVLRVEVNVADAHSGLKAAPQLDNHIGSDTSYSGYKEMKRIEGDKWGYSVDISSMPGAVGKTAFFKVNVRDAVGNLGIKMWERGITGEAISVGSAENVTVPTTVVEPVQGEGLDISDIKVTETTAPVVEVSGEATSIIWITQPSGEVNVGEKINIQGRLKPKMGKSAPLEITVTAPDGAGYVSRMDTNPSGVFEVNVPLTSSGEWKIFAEWKGDSEYASARSKVFTLQTISKKTGPDKMERATNFLKKNTMIIGAIVLYIIIINIST